LREGLKVGELLTVNGRVGGLEDDHLGGVLAAGTSEHNCNSGQQGIEYRSEKSEP
jgi:hypothetical protein